MTKTYFTIEAAREAIIDTLDNGYSGYIEDLHHSAFNEDYYIIGRYEAEKALEQYGVFKAIREVMDYEEEHFGQVTTELPEPERLANVLWYIIGEEVVYECIEHIEKTVDEEVYESYIEEPEQINKLTAAIREMGDE